MCACVCVLECVRVCVCSCVCVCVCVCVCGVHVRILVICLVNDPFTSFKHFCQAVVQPLYLAVVQRTDYNRHNCLERHFHLTACNLAFTVYAIKNPTIMCVPSSAVNHCD